MFIRHKCWLELLTLVDDGGVNVNGPSFSVRLDCYDMESLFHVQDDKS